MLSHLDTNGTTRIYRVNHVIKADRLMLSITGDHYSYGVGDDYPESYAIIPSDAWSEGNAYRVWRCQNGQTTDLIALIIIDPDCEDTPNA